MIRNSIFLSLFLFFLGLNRISYGQDMAGYSKQEIKDLSTKVEDQIQFLEYFLNTLGSHETPNRDKDVIIRESYQKIFRDGKVQVEDDLLLDRKVITNKDITAYLKDVDFFFNDAAFKFKIREIKPFVRDNGELSFLVSMDRTLTAIGLNHEGITNTKPRFVEVNVDKRSNELKIASIYTTKLSRDQELEEWWGSLSYTWESYFRSKIGLSEEDSITLDHLYKISSIDSINLSGNEFVLDLAPIEALRDLKYIDISNTKIEELNPISNVTFLSYLNISNTPTKDIQFIKYADRLEHLVISETPIYDISELGNLKQLHTLEASNTPIMGFDVLNSFEALRSLNLHHSGFNNIENINQLDKLSHLDISNNFLINFEMLADLKNLESINLEETNIVDLSSLSALENLKMVNINVTEVSDLSPLNDKLALQRVYADRTRISETDADEFSRRNRRVLLIHHAENLQTWWDALPESWKEILVKQNPALSRSIPLVEDLSYTVGLDSLDLSGSSINSLGPVLKFRKISKLNFDDTQVQDLIPLSEIKTLTSISGKNTQVKTLQPLANLMGLTYLNFANTPVDGISYLKGLPELTYLNVDKAFINIQEIPEFLEANPQVNIIYRSDSLKLWWDMLTDTWRRTIAGNFIQNYDPEQDAETLHRWTANSSLKIEKASISNLEPIIIFNNLRKLEVVDVPLTDITALAGMDLLEELKLSQAPVSDISPLAGLVNLKVLDLSNTGVEDLRPLSNLVNVTHLNLSGTNIKLLRGLEGLREIKELDIANTNVKSLKPIMNMVYIQRLICFNTRLNKKAVDSFRGVYPNCEVRFY
ncbi:leucine-rich repeat domain-containing protein [Shivajiella indica]|uniref:Leucine-rich repeat domain-containing protein n=1 Tax=Shivajiella indica TaxID=872115 RepID=A0ABW5B5S6_9BACT